MIHAFTSSCVRDLNAVLRLNTQLHNHEIEHYVFVEPAEYIVFSKFFPSNRLFKKPPGGDNGLGRAGSVCRWHIHRQMLDVTRDTNDTLLQIDSDVYFSNEKMIGNLTCEATEIKGFTGSRGESPVPMVLVNGCSFIHMSGMLIASSGTIFDKAMRGLSEDGVRDICSMLLNLKYECSEDIVASYLYQCKAGGILTPLQENWTRSLSKPSDENSYSDVIAYI